MKLLLCSPTQNIGGITKWTGYITNYLRENPHPEYSMELLPMENAGYLGENASKLKRLSKGISAYTRFIRKFHKTVSNEKFDIVHICSSASLGLLRDYLMLRICRRKKIPVCLHLHFGRIPELIKANNAEWKLMTKVLKLCTTVIVMNNESEDALRKEGFRNVANIPNPLSPDVVNLINRTEVAPKKNKFVFVGHILLTKGIEELISSMCQFSGIDLVLVGEDTLGIEKLMREKYSTAFSANTISFIGQQPHDKVIEEMKSGIFIFPSYSEGFPNVILESMACGVPVIASSVGSIPEMLVADSGHPCGFLVKSKDSRSLTEAMRFILENPDEGRKRGLNAKDRVNSNYNIHSVVKLLSDCWLKTSDQNN